MKQILTYINPKKAFNDEHKMAVKIQIDNSLSLGWKPEDIMLVTNFEYEYKGVKSINMNDNYYCLFHYPATKIYCIVAMFKEGRFEKDDIYWYHDFDCFQLNPFEGDILGSFDMGLTNYGRMPRLCSASIFFKKSAGDIFYKIEAEINRTKRGEEGMIMYLLGNNPDIRARVKHLDITYAFHRFNLPSCYKIVDKPIKAAHFHLTPDKYDFYVRGKNKLNLVLIPERLVNIFHVNGFTG